MTEHTLTNDDCLQTYVMSLIIGTTKKILQHQCFINLCVPPKEKDADMLEMVIDAWNDTMQEEIECGVRVQSDRK